MRACTQRKLFDKVRYELLDITIDLPIGFPINNIISLSLYELKKEITLYAFACHQTKVVVRYASRLDEPTDWRHEVVWLNPPWALLPAIIDKLQRVRPAVLLIIPHWPTAVWWPSMLALHGQMLALPLPKQVFGSGHAQPHSGWSYAPSC